MTTFNKVSRFSSLRGQDSTDFVSTDIAALESHMNRCASTRGRFFGLQTALEAAHSLMFPRLLTLVIASSAMLLLAGVV